MPDGQMVEKLTPKQVAAHLNVGLSTLCVWRKQHLGPPFFRYVKKVVYLRSDVEAWEFRNRSE